MGMQAAPKVSLSMWMETTGPYGHPITNKYHRILVEQRTPLLSSRHSWYFWMFILPKYRTIGFTRFWLIPYVPWSKDGIRYTFYGYPIIIRDSFVVLFESLSMVWLFPSPNLGESNPTFDYSFVGSTSREIFPSPKEHTFHCLGKL